MVTWPVLFFSFLRITHGSRSYYCNPPDGSKNVDLFYFIDIICMNQKWWKCTGQLVFLQVQSLRKHVIQLCSVKAIMLKLCQLRPYLLGHVLLMPLKSRHVCPVPSIALLNTTTPHKTPSWAWATGGMPVRIWAFFFLFTTVKWHLNHLMKL